MAADNITGEASFSGYANYVDTGLTGCLVDTAWSICIRGPFSHLRSSPAVEGRKGLSREQLPQRELPHRGTVHRRPCAGLTECRTSGAHGNGHRQARARKELPPSAQHFDLRPALINTLFALFDFGVRREVTPRTRIWLVNRSPIVMESALIYVCAGSKFVVRFRGEHAIEC